MIAVLIQGTVLVAAVLVYLIITAALVAAVDSLRKHPEVFGSIVSPLFSALCWVAWFFITLVSISLGMKAFNL
jgi:hypothetical protein